MTSAARAPAAGSSSAGLRRDRADLLVADHAVLVDDEGLGHAVDAPVDADAAVGVDDRHGRDRRSRASHARPARRVLVVEADDRHDVRLGERAPAADARRGTTRTTMPRRSAATPGPSGRRCQASWPDRAAAPAERGRGLVDQRRRHLARVADRARPRGSRPGRRRCRAAGGSAALSSCQRCLAPRRPARRTSRVHGER